MPERAIAHRRKRADRRLLDAPSEGGHHQYFKVAIRRPTGARRREETNAEKQCGGANELAPGGGTRDDEQPRREQPDGPAPRRLLIEAEYEYDFQHVA